ncbi:unnamed protein product, partial [Symbiodinium pilosum]
AGGKDLRATGTYPGVMGLKVAGLLGKHLASLKTKRGPPEGTMKFYDSGPETDSDSGLEDLLGRPS